MKTLHRPSRAITAALVSAAALMTIHEASAQSSGAAAVFEGRPAMAGAQAGTGAMAGPPQGGIGLQGSEGSTLRLRKPAIIEQGANMPQGTPDQPPPTVALSGSAQVQAGDLKPAQKDHDPGVARKQRSASDKVRRSAKRTAEGAKYGVSPIDTR